MRRRASASSASASVAAPQQPTLRMTISDPRRRRRELLLARERATHGTQSHQTHVPAAAWRIGINRVLTLVPRSPLRGLLLVILSRQPATHPIMWTAAGGLLLVTSTLALGGSPPSHHAAAAAAAAAAAGAAAAAAAAAGAAARAPAGAASRITLPTRPSACCGNKRARGEPPSPLEGLLARRGGIKIRAEPVIQPDSRPKVCGGGRWINPGAQTVHGDSGVERDGSGHDWLGRSVGRSIDRSMLAG